MDIEQLRIERKSAWDRVKRAKLALDSARSTLKEAEAEHFSASESYKTIDYRLAEVDGRLAHLEDAGKEAKKISEAEAMSIIAGMSREEVQRMIDQLEQTVVSPDPRGEMELGLEED